MRRSSILLATLFALAGCAEPQDEGWLGYVEAETAYVAPPQGGWITAINVTRGTVVKLGDTLFTLDSERETASQAGATAQIEGARAAEEQATATIAQSTARRVEIEATIVKALAELERQRELVRIGASPRRDLESAQAAYDSALATRNQVNAQTSQAQAQVSQARAQQRQAQAGLSTAETNLNERDVRARVAGRVENIFFRQGEYAAPGTPVVAILPAENIFVRFFIPEESLSGVQLGTRVRITCDGCAGNLTAAVSFIATEAEFTPPIIYSVKNRQKLVFKAEARAAGLNLRPGLPVSVTLLP